MKFHENCPPRNEQLVAPLSDTIIPLPIPVLVVQVGDYLPVSSAIRFLFLDLTCFIVENVLSHTYVFPNIHLCSQEFFSEGASQ